MSFNPTSSIESGVKVLYLPALGLAIVAHHLSNPLLLGVAVIYGIFASLVVPWIRGIALNLQSKRRNINPEDIVEHVSKWVRIDGEYSLLPVIVFTIALLGYVASIIVYFLIGMSNRLVVLILLVQILAPVRILGGAIVFVTNITD